MINKIKKLSRFIGRDAFVWLVLGALSSILLSFVEMGFSLLMQLLFYKANLLKEVLIPNRLGFTLEWSLLSLCIIFSFLGVTRAILTILTSQSGNFFSNITNARLRLISIYDLLISPRTRVLAASESNLRFAEIFPKASSFVSSSTTGGIAFIQATSLFIALSFIGLKEALVGLTGVLLIGFVMKMIRGEIKTGSQKILDEQTKINKSIQRVTQNWVNIKILRTHHLEHSNVVLNIMTYLKRSMRNAVFIRLGGVFPNLFGSILIAIVIYTSSTVFKSSSSTLLPFLYLFLRFVQSLAALADSYFNSVSHFPSFKRAFDIFYSFDEKEILLALAPMQNWKRKIDNGNIDMGERSNHAPNIQIENLLYRWDSNQEYIFKGLNLNIPPNSVFGIVGPSGCGKSTLLFLILGIIRPEIGKITFDQIPAPKYLDKHFPEIGYVGPDPFLTEGSIRDNLLYGQKDCDSILDEDLKFVLNQVKLSVLADDLGYRISENSEGLSSGQKQRVAIARSLLRKPKLIIFDEATANLDSVTEVQISDLLLELKKSATIIVVTHRVGMLKHADNVLKLGSES